MKKRTYTRSDGVRQYERIDSDFIKGEGNFPYERSGGEKKDGSFNQLAIHAEVCGRVSIHNRLPLLWGLFRVERGLLLRLLFLPEKASLLVARPQA